MYILMSILLSLIYIPQISCAASSALVISHKIHTIFNKSTMNSADGRSLAELLQDHDACERGRFFMNLLRAHEPYQALMTGMQHERDKKTRRSMRQQLDLQVYLFLTQKREEVLDDPRLSAAMQDSALKGLVIANVLFQQELLTRYPAAFQSLFHHKLVGSRSSK